MKNKQPREPDGFFDLIVIDPPWEFNIKYDEVTGYGRAGLRDYPEMPFQDILNIRLPMAEDCFIFLWVVQSFLLRTHEVIQAWGLDLIDTIVWDKEILGIGSRIRRQHEYCFILERGKPTWVGNDIRSIIREQRTSHSTKPIKLYEIINNNYPHFRKLDYFSRGHDNRKHNKTWEHYGNEAEQKRA